MKTYLVNLEAHDDVNSARDKMAWSQSARLAMVWPERGRILQRKLDLVLLQRFSQQQGCQMALVTRDRQVIDHALELGIPVFRSVQMAQRLSWRRPRRLRPPQRRPHPLAGQKDEFYRRDVLRVLPGLVERLIPFTAGVLAVLAMAVFFLPGATVAFTQSQQDQLVSLKVWANPAIQEVNLSGGLPIRPVTVVVEGQSQVISSGTMSLPDRPARGTVRLVNLSDRELTVPSGTVVLTAWQTPVRFRTLREVRLKPGKENAQEVEVLALNPGSSGNVAANQIQAIEGVLGAELMVFNPEPTYGGSDRITPAPSQSDVQLLHERLLETLRQAARNELQAQLKDEQELIPASLRISKVLKERSEPPQGLPADRLTLTMQVEFEAWAVLKKDLQRVSLTALDASLPAGYTGVGDTVRVLRVTEPVIEDGTARWEVLATRKMRLSWSRDPLVQSILGSEPSQAKRELQEMLGLAEPPVITLYPAWWPRLPFLALRIQVVGQ